MERKTGFFGFIFDSFLWLIFGIIVLLVALCGCALILLGNLIELFGDIIAKLGKIISRGGQFLIDWADEHDVSFN